MWRANSGATRTLEGVWGTDANNVWAVGEAGTILKWDGSEWHVQSTGTEATLYAVRGTDANNVWAVGSWGTILKWDGSAWRGQSSGTTNELYAIWGTDANNVWAVGSWDDRPLERERLELAEQRHNEPASLISGEQTPTTSGSSAQQEHLYLEWERMESGAGVRVS